MVSEGSVKISRILHAGYVFEHEGTQIAFDPIFENPFSKNCYAFPNVQFNYEKIRNIRFAAVFISHFHDDHCSFESLNLLDRATPIYMFCVFEAMFSLIKDLGFTHVYSLKLDETIKIGQIEITPRKALDEDVDSIFHIKAGGLNILNVVDSWIDDETLLKLSEDTPWDFVLWPFQTMREIEVIAPSRATPAPKEIPSEWIDQLKILKPKYLVPSSCQFVQESWSWYNHAFFPISYRSFTEQIEKALPETQVVRMNPSASIILSKNLVQKVDSLPWIERLDSQDVDYQYDPEITPPLTCDIAKKFEALNVEQTKKVFDYCKMGLLEKYKSMDVPLDAYFEKSRLWKLSIYDHKGEVTEFFYLVDGADIKTCEADNDNLGWCTEVPLAKFYAALELGESLTSMYMRVNDFVFESKTEKEIAEADIVDDPLIRCLFNGIFGAYQRAQLKRIYGL